MRWLLRRFRTACPCGRLVHSTARISERSPCYTELFQLSDRQVQPSTRKLPPPRSTAPGTLPCFLLAWRKTVGLGPRSPPALPRWDRLTFWSFDPSLGSIRCCFFAHQFSWAKLFLKLMGKRGACSRSSSCWLGFHAWRNRDGLNRAWPMRNGVDSCMRE